MSHVYATCGLVFKKEDRMEADRVFSVFTQDFGRVEILGRAIRKIDSKLKGGIDIFSFSDIEFVQGKKRKTLTDALFTKNYRSITKDPQKFAVACRMAEVLEHFIKGQEPDAKMWDFLQDVFEKLERPATNNKFLYYYFFWNLVAILGHAPQLQNCAQCHQALRPEVLYFSNKEGGVICNNCFSINADATKITSDAVKILRLILQKNWEILSKLKIPLASKKLLKEISDSYGQYLIGNYSL